MNAKPEQYSRIFLISHMRAFTSLTGHILGSNPAINGYYEMHLSYDNASALEKQLSEYSCHDDIKKNSSYLFDKLLHNDYLLIPESLAPVAVNILVSLREPESTINSIVNLFALKKESSLYASPVEAAGYYMNRLKWMADLCSTLEHDYYYFDAMLFKTAPHKLLSTLSNWLKLTTPLSEEYQVFSQTGEDRKGDTSRFIHSGKIDTTDNSHTNTHIPEHLLEKAHSVYLDCRQQMLAHAKESLTL